ncbi:MAG: zf-TFIIB domain-containing protein [Verrucomicrobiota bacterium]|jgi:Zn-finger nucleic acid-binding protein
MPAETLNCPMCGAAVSTEAARCEHCGARLATVACPSCFGMMFAGEKFCSHCGAKADRVETADARPEPCPRCRVEMNAVVIGGSHLRECPRCEGIWADADTLRQICEDKEKQSAVLGVASPAAAPETVELETHVHYIPCPVCGKLMNRVQFAHCSHVVVNVCGQHGTWFDRDELRHIVEFIRAGGLENARAQEIAELEREKRAAEWRAAAGNLDFGSTFSPGSRHELWGTGISAAAGFLSALMRSKW